jgi:glycine oxidase
MKVAIVGAGLVGRLLAWHLCHAHEIHLFDRPNASEKSACSFAAGAMISPYAEISVLGNAWHEKAKQALSWWPKILSTLPKSVYYQARGSLLIVHPQHRALFDHFINGIKRQLPHYAAQIRDDSVDKISCILPEEAHLNPRQLLEALAEYLLAKGVYWHQKVIHKIKAKNLIIEEQHIAFDRVIDCRGYGAKQMLPDLRALRGEIVICEAPHIALTRAVRFLHPVYSCYIVPQGNHRYVIGATEIESDSEQPIAIKSMMMLMSGAMLVEPRFRDAHIVDMKVGLRPTTPTHLPAITEQQGVLYINGLFRHGFLLAPALIAEVADKIMSTERVL